MLKTMRMNHAMKNSIRSKTWLKSSSFLNADQTRRVELYLPNLQAYVAKHNVPGSITLPRFIGTHVGDSNLYVGLSFPKPHRIHNWM